MAAAPSWASGCGAASFASGAISLSATDLAGRRRPRLEPGHQPQLRPRADVSGHQSERRRAASSGRSTILACRASSSCLATGMGSATVSRAGSASPVTSDRSHDRLKLLSPGAKAPGVFFRFHLIRREIYGPATLSGFSHPVRLGARSPGPPGRMSMAFYFFDFAALFEKSPVSLFRERAERPRGLAIVAEQPARWSAPVSQAEGRTRDEVSAPGQGLSAPLSFRGAKASQ